MPTYAPRSPWTVAMDDSTAALRICGRLQPFWGRHGHVREGKRWFEQSLALRADAPVAVRAKALGQAGQLEHVLGNQVQAQALAEQSLALYRTINDQPGIATLTLQLGGIHRAQAHYAQARRMLSPQFPAV